MTKSTTFARKILQLGKYSLAIVLPKQVLRRFGWKERQKIVVSVRGRDALVIRDWKPPARQRRNRRRR